MHHRLHAFTFIEVSTSEKDESAKSFSTFSNFVRTNLSRVTFDSWSKETGKFVRIAFVSWRPQRIGCCYPTRTHHKRYIVTCHACAFCNFCSGCSCSCQPSARD